MKKTRSFNFIGQTVPPEFFRQREKLRQICFSYRSHERRYEHMQKHGTEMDIQPSGEPFPALPPFFRRSFADSAPLRSLPGVVPKNRRNIRLK